MVVESPHPVSSALKRRERTCSEQPDPALKRGHAQNIGQIDAIPWKKYTISANREYWPGRSMSEIPIDLTQC